MGDSLDRNLFRYSTGTKKLHNFQNPGVLRLHHWRHRGFARHWSSHWGGTLPWPRWRDIDQMTSWHTLEYMQQELPIFSIARLLSKERHLHQWADPRGGQHVPDCLLDRVGRLLRTRDPIRLHPSSTYCWRCQLRLLGGQTGGSKCVLYRFNLEIHWRYLICAIIRQQLWHACLWLSLRSWWLRRWGNKAQHLQLWCKPSNSINRYRWIRVLVQILNF